VPTPDSISIFSPSKTDLQALKKGKFGSRGIGRPKNDTLRPRFYLTPDEVERLIAAARKASPRHDLRDSTLILLMYRHGLRVTEAVHLQWSQVDLNQASLYVRRAKRGIHSVHPLKGGELRALRQLKREYPETPYIFVTERKTPLEISTARKLVKRAGVVAELPFPIHPHMLRHACGYVLANAGQDTRSIQHYLGHRNIQHTVRYTELCSERFRDFWSD